MKLPRAHQIIPPIVFTAAAAIPAGTTFEMLVHTPKSSTPRSFALVAAVAPSAKPTSTHRTTSKRKAKTRGRAKARPVKAVPHVYVGMAAYDRYGAVQATITVSGRRIVNVAISAPQSEPRSASINAQAVPLLRSQTLQSQNANVNTVSGATETSNAYAQSLQAALQAAHLA